MNAPDPRSATVAPADPTDITSDDPGYSGTVGRAMVWQSLSTGLAKILSFFAQIVLGWLLLDDDFGAYAIGLSVVSFLGVFRAGGARELMIQGGAKNYDELAGPLFWMAVAFDVGSGILIGGAAPLVGAFYGRSDITWVILIAASTIPMGTPGVMLTAKLIADLRFKELAISVASVNVVRYVGAIIFASMGFGALSFVLPVPLMCLVEFLIGRHFVRDRPWHRPAQPRRWPGLFSRSRWIIFTTFTGSVIAQGENIIIGAFVPAGVLGVFFFAKQIVQQTGVLLAWNFHQVLFPTFSRMDDDRERQERAIVRALAALSLASAAFMGIQAATFGPLEHFLWRGKWDAAVLPMQIAAVLYPMRMLYTVAEAACAARLRFKLLGAAMVILGAVLVASAAIGAKLWGTPVAMMACTAGTTAAASLILNSITLKLLGVRRRDAARATLPAWIVGAIAVALAFADDRLAATLAPNSTAWSRPAQMVFDALRVGVLGSLFGTLTLALARAFFPGALLELLKAIPRGWGLRLASRLRLDLFEPSPAA
ncbi:MAG TPA: oligosaccharide flippase family protein [Phycisphaerales bacterium]|nr:oligosaccharide flippase family protein [Phycisphaerales bacterium]